MTERMASVELEVPDAHDDATAIEPDDERRDRTWEALSQRADVVEPVVRVEAKLAAARVARARVTAAELFLDLEASQPLERVTVHRVLDHATVLRRFFLGVHGSLHGASEVRDEGLSGNRRTASHQKNKQRKTGHGRRVAHQASFSQQTVPVARRSATMKCLSAYGRSRELPADCRHGTFDRRRVEEL